ncbi:fucose isomerase [Prolixibacter bellariivorans]|uniref:Fucose isomerase n=1 Tax=Prolixibacter bellariivorans TaxID=314319 RepID=A0A5M4ATP8_9BACT|nr:fucose isomerase [Prolixibacter bellariivorans]GET31305.1 fucose isomerase [Prolixibacter bellariivorans]
MKPGKQTFGVIIATRNIFNYKLAVEARKKVLAKLDSMGFGYVILPEDETPTGNIEGYADAVKCGAFFKKNSDLIEGIIVVLPNFGDELGVVNTIKLSGLNVPVLVQAVDDDNDKVDVKSRRDAFCGKLSVCNNFYQYGIKFTDTTYHTYSLDSAEFTKDLIKFASICRVVKGLSNLRVGAIGTRPIGFQTMRYSEKLLQKYGITIVPVDMSEIIAAAEKIDKDDPAVLEKAESIQLYGACGIASKGKVAHQARFGLAVENWINENNIDISALQCWESIEKNFGCAACVTMSMMGEKLMPSACEVDVAGTISMYALALAAQTPSAILDWNNNFAEDRDKVVATHCSNYPKSFFQSEIEIGSLDVLGTVLGSEDTFGAVKGKVAAGDMTYFRISTDDNKGIIKTYLGEGKMTDDPYGMDGGIAVCEIPNLQNLMKFMCKNGFEHHVAMVRGHVSEVLEEAIGNYLGWDLYKHE